MKHSVCVLITLSIAQTQKLNFVSASLLSSKLSSSASDLDKEEDEKPRHLLSHHQYLNYHAAEKKSSSSSSSGDMDLAPTRKFLRDRKQRKRRVATRHKKMKRGHRTKSSLPQRGIFNTSNSGRSTKKELITKFVESEHEQDLPLFIQKRVKIAPSVAPTDSNWYDDDEFNALDKKKSNSNSKSSKDDNSPSFYPSVPEWGEPSASPTQSRSSRPTKLPSLAPSALPSLAPSSLPSLAPSALPSFYPSTSPSTLPSFLPSSMPSLLPSRTPTTTPSTVPSIFPSDTPSATPSTFASTIPSVTPSTTPSTTPSAAPSSCEILQSTYVCASSDCDILRDLFLATGGCTSWSERRNWLQSDDICEWQGISCTENLFGSQGYEITEINLASNGLQGYIPYSLGGLFFLNQIDLSYNYLTGTIPASLGALQSLEIMNLARNDYNNLENFSTGIIPNQVCDLFTDGVLNDIIADCSTSYPMVQCDCCTICANEKPSSIPSHIPSTLSFAPSITPPACEAPSTFSCTAYNKRSTCEALVDFYESTGGCYWTLGADEWLNTETMPGIGLRDPFCDWYGVACETDCSSNCDVISIELYDNNLRGTIPGSLANLSQLNSLELQSNNISGTLPTSLGMLPSLTRLVLDENRFTGSYNSGDDICSLVESGQLQQFWMDCQAGDTVTCDCCTFCGY